MRINVNAAKKRAEIWLTHTEANDESVRTRLTEMYGLYRKMKYMVAVFISGTYDLLEQTSMLLRNNI